LNAPASAIGEPSPASWLRSETRADHARVDQAFGRFDLASRDGYTAFLVAQARVLAEIEAQLCPAELIPGWKGRAGPLAADLAALDCPMPSARAVEIPPGQGARHGALYVLEGSRLGGAVLSRTVPAGLPRAFLGATHPHGAWRALLALLDTAGLDRQAMLAGARSAFAAFIGAACD
jgi:heme oxygenase